MSDLSDRIEELSTAAKAIDPASMGEPHQGETHKKVEPVVTAPTEPKPGLGTPPAPAPKPPR